MEHSKYMQQALLALQNEQTSVIVFQAAVYSHIFFMQFFESIKSQQTIDCKTIDIQSGDFNFKSQLSTSFLGMNCLYWLGDVSLLKSKQKDDIIDYLVNYQGPHKVILFLDDKASMVSSQHLVVLPMKEKYFFQDAKSILVFQDSKQAQKTILFLQEIYKFKNSFMLDELSLLKNYQHLISGDAQEFYESWIRRLVIPDTSLFTLSQLFFEKKEKDFFRLWLNIKPLYGEMFWIAFWSDQLYRAYFFIAFTQANNFVAVKQVSFGLAFSFMKQSYKNYTLSQLQRAHQALYMIDSSLKNSGSSYLIDQWYVAFLTDTFT